MTPVDPCVVHEKNTHPVTPVYPYVVHEKNRHAVTPGVVNEKNRHAMTVVHPCVVCLEEHTCNDTGGSTCSLWK